MSRKVQLSVRIEVIPMYYRESVRAIRIVQYTNGKLMRGQLIKNVDGTEMMYAMAKAYSQSLATRFYTSGAKVKVIWPFA